MIKKLTVPLIFALILTLLVSTVAFAADATPLIRIQLAYGAIVALDENSFTVQSPTDGGAEFTFFVDQNTAFRAIKDQAAADFSDLELGGKVAVRGQVGDDDQITARFVLLLPDDFSPAGRFSVRTCGQVSKINLDAGTFSVGRLNGESATFVVGEKTRFVGGVKDLSDLRISQSVVVTGKVDQDGSNLAVVILTHKDNTPRPFAGTIAGVSPAAGTFQLTTRQGIAITFAVDENTQFISPNKDIQSLAAVQPDMVAIVVASSQNDGVNLVTRIAVGERDDFPKFEIKVRGQITALDANSLTVQTGRGETLVFQTTEETKFRGRADIQSQGDLEIGMHIFIGGRELDTGELFAQWIVLGVVSNP